MSQSWNRVARLRGVMPAARVTAAAVLVTAAFLTMAGSASASTLPTVTLTVTPTSITVGGTLQSGGVNVVTTATGVKESSAILVQLKPGVTAAELYAYFESKEKKDVNEVVRFGSIVFDGEVEAGSTTEAQTTLQPGQYVALVAGNGGPPKLRASFTVTKATSPAVLPTPQAKIRTFDFGFAGPATLHNGELVGVENEGFLVHMNAALQVKNMKAAKKLVKLMLAGKEKQANKLVIGGFSLAGPVSHGAYQQLTIHAKPGVYVEACFMETQDKRDHTRLGMERIIKVTK